MPEEKKFIGSLLGTALYVDENTDEETLKHLTRFLATMMFRSEQLKEIRSILDKQHENLS